MHIIGVTYTHYTLIWERWLYIWTSDNFFFREYFCKLPACMCSRGNAMPLCVWVRAEEDGQG